MKHSLHCFTCKKPYEVSLDKESVHLTKNNRHYANKDCEVCGRKMTSLVKREVYSNLNVNETTQIQ